MNERKGRVLEALLETVEFAVLSYAMSGAAFALRRPPGGPGGRWPPLGWPPA